MRYEDITLPIRDRNGVSRPSSAGKMRYHGKRKDGVRLTNDDLLAWSVAAIAAAFIVSCGYLIALLRAARRSLDTAQAALQEVKATVRGLEGEVVKLGETVNAAAEDVRSKLACVDPLFGAAKEAGIALGEMASAAREAARGVAGKVREHFSGDESDERSRSWIGKTASALRIATLLGKAWIDRKGSTYSHVKEEI